MAKSFCRIIGIVFLALGLIGFAAPSLMGMHMSTGHNLIHLITGGIAVYLGWRGSYQQARVFCYCFGVVYALLGVVGFLSPPGVPMGMVPGVSDAHLLRLIPGQIEFGTADSIIHLIAGAAFLLAALRKPRATEQFAGIVDATKQRMGV